MARNGGLIPQQVDREGRGRHEQEIRPLTDDLIREVVRVASLCLERLGSARHAVSIARRRFLPPVRSSNPQAIQRRSANTSGTTADGRIFTIGVVGGRRQDY
jgi:hypothetical protein